MKRKMVALIAVVMMMAAAAWAATIRARCILRRGAGLRWWCSRTCSVRRAPGPSRCWSRRSAITNCRWCATTLSFRATPGAWKHTSWRGTSIRSRRSWARSSGDTSLPTRMRSTRRTCGSGRTSSPPHTTRRCPAFYDPTGALRAKVEADTALGKATGVRQTPTIYVVSNSKQEPYVQVPEQGKAV